MFVFPPPPSGLAAPLARRDEERDGRRHFAKQIGALHRLWQYRRYGFLSGKRFLDYGGSGYLAAAARRFGFLADTYNPLAKSSAAVALPAGDYDVVACHHVLEHVPDPGGVLDDLRGRLAPRGTLILAVPNRSSIGYERRGFGWVWSGPAPTIHLHHFTAIGLGALALRRGFRVVREIYLESWEANALADVELAALFTRLKRAESRSRWPKLVAQLDSAARFLAFAGTYTWPNVQGEKRAELLLSLRRGA